QRHGAPAGQRDRAGVHKQVAVAAVAAIHQQVALVIDGAVEIGIGTEVGGVGALDGHRTRRGAAIQVVHVSCGCAEERAAIVVQRPALDGSAGERHRGARAVGLNDAAAGIVYRGGDQLQGPVVGRLYQAQVVERSVLKRQNRGQRPTSGVGIDETGRVVVEDGAIVVNGAFALDGVIHVVQGYAVFELKIGVATAGEGDRDRNEQVGVGAVAAIHLQVGVIHDRTVEVGLGAEVSGIGAVQRDRARDGAAIQVVHVSGGRSEERGAIVVQGA